MPTASIEYVAAANSLNQKAPLISTPLGICMLEIQGHLNLPHVASDHTHDAVILDNGHQAVRFGRLEFDESNPAKVVLYIGNSQRLLGSVVDLATPLGVLRIPTNGDNHQAQMVDVIKKKLIFKERPLPVM